MLLQLRDEGVLARFAIGGAVAASFYIEAVATEDLDIFAFLRRSASGLVLLTPLYDRLTQLGATVQEEQTYDGLRVPVVTADYLCAIAPQTGRPKDYQRVHSLFEADCITPETIRQLIQAYDLQKRWEEYVRRYA